nr:uncharacterized protein LOC122273555 [Parasteatoda tepidariorum]
MTKALEDLINKKGSEYKQKLLDLIDRFLGKDGQFAEQHSLGDSRRSVQDAEIQQIEFNLKDLFRKLKKELLETIDKEKVKAMIEKLFGKGSDVSIFYLLFMIKLNIFSIFLIFHAICHQLLYERK